MEAHQKTATDRPVALVIDDDEGIRATMVEILEDQGFEVLEARNGLEALNVFTTAPKPALICLDMAMPVLDGWTFCRVRERVSTLLEIPVVAISGSRLSASEAPLRVDAMLEKPFAPAQLAWLAATLTGSNRRNA